MQIVTMLLGCHYYDFYQVHVIYLDFSKAFDAVSHSILLHYCPAEAGSPWLGQVRSWLGEEVAGGPGPESGGEWS